MIVESVGLRWMAKEEEFGVGCEEVYRLFEESSRRVRLFVRVVGSDVAGTLEGGTLGSSGTTTTPQPRR
jgi:hypothetical protein